MEHKKEYNGIWVPTDAQEQAEEDYFAALAEKLVPFHKKRCPTCKGQGMVAATNAAGVEVHCRQCGGSGLLKGNPVEHIVYLLTKKLDGLVKELGYESFPKATAAEAVVQHYLKLMQEDKQISGYRTTLEEGDENYLWITIWGPNLGGRRGTNLEFEFQDGRVVHRRS